MTNIACLTWPKHSGRRTAASCPSVHVVISSSTLPSVRTKVQVVAIVKAVRYEAGEGLRPEPEEAFLTEVCIASELHRIAAWRP